VAPDTSIAADPLPQELKKQQILRVLTAFRAGDFSVRLPSDLPGLDGRIADALNEVIARNQSLSEELSRVSKVVGKEGKISERVSIGHVRGGWSTDVASVNTLISNLAYPISETARVIGAVAKGDLSQSMSLDIEGRPISGEFLHTAQTVNTMVEQLGSFAVEVTRVAREVGTDGKLGGQAKVAGVAGTWKDLTDSVNSMASNLTSQVRNIAAVTTAVANGDLSKKITVAVKGEMLELKNTINTMVDQLNSFASEVTRVAREVGTEGELGGQAEVRGVAGTWKDLTDSVNSMARNLTSQVRNIAAVTTAVANGDLSKKITVDVKGEILELKNTVNTMVDQLSSFAAEVTRVAKEVGNEGKLGGQASVPGVAGTWKDLTDSVNSMAGNLTDQVRNVAAVTTAVANGDVSKKITVDVKGEMLELKNTINTMVDQLRSFAAEVTRVAREVGTEGKLGGQASVPGVAGTWKDLTDNVNSMASNLTSQVRNIAAVTTAVANGDLSKKITVDVRGEIAELKDTINTMVDQLNSFANEVTRVAREVGTEGKLGGQADVKGVAGTWKDLTDNVNSMAGNLTNQVRGIAKVVTAVANGDLKRKLAVDAKGEIAELADTINGMIDTLAIFADQVTTMAREVGVEGKLGGQASVPGASGTWKDLTDNVNQLAANLTTQVRAIADVATAVTRGDLTRSIQVEAQGEVAALKDNINEMIRNLKDTTLKNAEQDWLKTNLAKFSRMLQGQKDLLTVGKLILSELAPVVDAQHGVFFIMDTAKPDQPMLRLLASYAYKGSDQLDNRLKLGEGLVGQCALEKQKILLSNVPPGYIRIASGLGQATPLNIIVIPILFEGHVKAVLELASFDRFSPMHEVFLDQLCESIGIVLNTIEANTRTEDLLEQSQSLARELQSRQEELQKTNAELEDKAKLLADQNVEVERKNTEVEQARQALEEKAKQLALTSKYKSEFLANMSHELRTPLNSLLILSDQLCRNHGGNLTSRQIEFAKTIHSAGNDLLMLINDILDLSKIESGTVVIDVTNVVFRDLQDYVERTFRHIAESKRLAFEVEAGHELPATLQTDPKRLQQILKNLLSNAFKFTDHGSVCLAITQPQSGWTPDNEMLNRAAKVIAFSVTDTGIGIPPEKQQIIFEAFQQADGSTNRKYGGTGLGLAISREIAHLLGGEIRLISAPGEGTTFTLYLPQPFTSSRQWKSPAPHERLLGSGPSSEPAADASDPILDREELAVDAADDLNPDAPVLLIVENDLSFVRILVEAAREEGWRPVVRTQGGPAIATAHELVPDAITLDMNLPDVDGWRVLAHLKDDLGTRHIPIHVISTDDHLMRAMCMGAVGVLSKPVLNRERLVQAIGRLDAWRNPRKRTVLLGDTTAAVQQSIAGWLASDRFSLLSALPDAIPTAVEVHRPDVLIVPPELDGESTVGMLRRLAETGTGADLPVIVSAYGPHSAMDMAEIAALRDILPVRVARSNEHLLDALCLVLHLGLDQLPTDQQETLRRLHDPAAVLSNRQVLIVDDDIRNIFAMTSILERYQMRVAPAETGQEAINVLQRRSDVDVVLMDIMMPGMDGYETIRAIRRIERFQSLPIIALTAKAMKGDREKCIQAGASDYIAKPVHTDQLVAILRKWLYRDESHAFVPVAGAGTENNISG
jgi:signal transduction histidine kinase/HAMP domain-containing protein/CheY-like chemotaxis protein